MHLNAPALLTFLYLLTSTATASPFPLLPRTLQTNSSSSPSSDQITPDDADLLSTLCLAGDNEAACQQLRWPPKVVAFMRKNPPNGAVGSMIQPTNSTAPPSVQAAAEAAAAAAKRDNGTVKMPASASASASKGEGEGGNRRLPLSSSSVGFDREDDSEDDDQGGNDDDVDDGGDDGGDDQGGEDDGTAKVGSTINGPWNAGARGATS